MSSNLAYHAPTAVLMKSTVVSAIRRDVRNLLLMAKSATTLQYRPSTSQMRPNLNSQPTMLATTFLAGLHQLRIRLIHHFPRPIWKLSLVGMCRICSVCDAVCLQLSQSADLSQIKHKAIRLLKTNASVGSHSLGLADLPSRLLYIPAVKFRAIFL